MTNQLQCRELDAAVDRALGYPVVIGESPYNPFDETPAPYRCGFKDGCEYDWQDVPSYSTDETAAELLLQQCMKQDSVRGALILKNDVKAGYQEGFTSFIHCCHVIGYRGEGITVAEAKTRACLALLEAAK